MKKTIALVFVVVAVVCVAVYVNRPQRPGQYLIAQDIVPVYLSEEDAISQPPSQVTLHLAKSQRVQVLGNVDVKHYLIYKIRMPDGQVGFVNDGKYSFEKQAQ